MVTKFKAAFKSDIGRNTERVELEDLKILQDPSYRRFESYIDIEMAVEIFKKKRYHCSGRILKDFVVFFFL